MSDSKKIIFCGTPVFAATSLRALLDAGIDVPLVITQPDRPVGRKKALTPPPVKVLAEERGIPVWQPENLNAEVENKPLPECDYLVVVAYGQILSQVVLDAPRIAPLNVHASLLPRFRGASPIQHSILAEERETGVTIQKMVKALDAGDIVVQEKIQMDDRETFPSLHDKLMEMGARLLVKIVTGSSLTFTEQDETKVIVCHKFTREDGFVDPKTMTAEDIDRKVRALVPWPGVTWGHLKLLKTELKPHADAYQVECSDESLLYITQLQPSGKKPMKGIDYARGKK